VTIYYFGFAEIFLITHLITHYLCNYVPEFPETILLKIFNNNYFFPKINDYHTEGYDFSNLMKFYEIRETDFEQKFGNYIYSFSSKKISDEEFTKKIPKNPKKISEKKKNYLKKILKLETQYRKKLVYIKNESDKDWIEHGPITLNFDSSKNDHNEHFFQKPLAEKVLKQITNSIENKITFDFYSLYWKYCPDKEIKFNNQDIEEWYSNQLEQLSNYVSGYFEKIML